MSAPAISVVLPVFNGARHIAEAVASVRAQGHPQLEIIVIDDGSTDQTPAAIASLEGPDLRCDRQENRGPAAARNRGLALARGEIIGFIDADDLWPGDKLAAQLPHLAPGNGIDMVIGLTQYFRQREGSPSGRESLEAFFCFVMGCGLYTRGAMEKVGPLNESMRYGEDTDWFHRAIEAGVPMRILESAGILYRRHEGNITRNVRRAREGYIEALRSSLVRRRAAGGGRARPLEGLHLPPAASRGRRQR